MKALVASVVLFVVSQVPAAAALNAYMKVTGQKQGQIKGQSTDNKIPLTHFSSASITAEEHQTGQMKSGHRKWAPLVLHVADTAALAHLRRAMNEREHLTIDLVVNETEASGKVGPKYTVHLIGSQITAIKQLTVDGKPTAELSLNFTKIEWTWVKGGVTASDDWEART